MGNEINLNRIGLNTLKAESPVKFKNFNQDESEKVSIFDLKINNNNIDVYEGNIFNEFKVEDLKLKVIDKDGLQTDSKNDITLSLDGKLSAAIDFNSILRSFGGFNAKVTGLNNPPGIRVDLKTLFTPEVCTLRLEGQDKLAIHIGKAVQLLGMESEILKNLANIFKISEQDFISSGNGNYALDLKKVLNNFKKLNLNGKNLQINEIKPGDISIDVPNPTTPGPHNINIKLNNTKVQAETGSSATNETLPDDAVLAKVNGYIKFDEIGRNYQTAVNVDGNASLMDKAGFDFSVDYQKNGKDITGDIKINNFEKSVEAILKDYINKNSQGKFKADVKIIRDNNSLKVKIDGQYGVSADLNMELKDNKFNIDLGHIKLLKLPALEAPERAEAILKAYLPLKRNEDIISIDINSTLNKYLPDSIRTQYKLTDINLTNNGLNIKFNSFKEGETVPTKPELPQIDFKASKPNGIHLETCLMNSTPSLTLSYQRDVYKLNVSPLSDPVVRVTIGPVVSLGLGNGEAGHIRVGAASEARLALTPIGAPYFVGLGTDLTYGNLGTQDNKFAFGLGPTIGYDNGKVTAGIGYKREFVFSGKDFNAFSASVGIRF